MRGPMALLEQDDWAKANFARVITTEEVVTQGVPHIIAEVRRIIGDGPVYLSFDLDAIDPAYAPAVADPENRRPHHPRSEPTAARFPRPQLPRRRHRLLLPADGHSRTDHRHDLGRHAARHGLPDRRPPLLQIMAKSSMGTR